MKRLFRTIVFTVLVTTPARADDIQKISTFCKFWGFLKYYHPEVAKGKIDWDDEFLKRYPLILTGTENEINAYYLQWIKELGEIPGTKPGDNKTYKILPDHSWMHNSDLSDDLITKLEYIVRNRNTKKNYYLDNKNNLLNLEFKNERSYPDSVFPSEQMRLLSLSRYWNIIHYFFPYKYLMDQNWNEALNEMIPKFRFAEDTIDYHLAMLELTAKINDSHTKFGTLYTQRYFGTKWVPFNFKIIDDKAVVIYFFSDSLCKEQDIRVGDVCLKVNNRTIKEILDEKSQYINCSNPSGRLRNAYYAIFNGNTDSVNITFERDGREFDKIIRRYEFRSFKRFFQEDTTASWKIIDDNIGYVNMGKLVANDVPEMMSQLQNTKALLFDIRNYPNETIYLLAAYLNPESVPYVKYTLPDSRFPGAFYESPVYKAGGGIRNYQYAGKIIYLFNEETQSHAEITVMIMQTIPNSIGIGSQSAGADGNVSQLCFPGAYKTRFTGIGVYYPDGRETQRIGLHPDIEVKPTIQGIRQGKDEVLEKAIEVANSK